MNGLDEIVRALAWALIHFLWQGALIAMALEVVLLGLRGRSSELRYLVRCAALVLMGIAPFATLRYLLATSTPPAELLAAALPAGAELEGALSTVDPWLAAAVALWGAVVATLWARLLRDYLRIRRLQKSEAGAPLPAAWQARFDAIADSMGVRAVARVVDSAAVAVPTVIGWLRPVVLMPARVLTGLDQEQVEALLAHELAHVRRHDFAVNLVQSVIESLLFYHPAVWWVSSGIRTEREYCCDDAALRAAGDRMTYARALTTLESWRGASFPEPAVQAGMSTLGGSFMRRIQRMVGVRPEPRRRAPRATLGALVVLTALGATAFGGALPEALAAHDPEALHRIRENIESLEQRLAELRALLRKVESGTPHEASEPENAFELELRFEVDSGGDVSVSPKKTKRSGDAADRDGNVMIFSTADGDRPTVVLGESPREGSVQVFTVTGDGGPHTIVLQNGEMLELESRGAHPSRGDGGSSWVEAEEHAHEPHAEPHPEPQEPHALPRSLRKALHGTHRKLDRLFGDGDGGIDVRILSDGKSDVVVRGFPGAEELERELRELLEKHVGKADGEAVDVWVGTGDGPPHRVHEERFELRGGDGEPRVLILRGDGKPVERKGRVLEALDSFDLDVPDFDFDFDVRMDGKELRELRLPGIRVEGLEGKLHEILLRHLGGGDQNDARREERKRERKLREHAKATAEHELV